VTDGDADRIGAVAEDGSFVDSHKCMCVLLKWLLEYKKWPGDVVRAFNTTGMMDRIAAKYGRKLYECNIGFKYIADLMMEHDILIGGEESGGIGYGRFLPERDGILNALLLANVMAEEEKPLGQLVADLQREFGAHYYGRRDLHISDEMKNGSIRRAADPQTTKLGAYSILRKENRDGVKFYLDAPKYGNGADPWYCFALRVPNACCAAMWKRRNPNWSKRFLKAASASCGRSRYKPFSTNARIARSRTHFHEPKKTMRVIIWLASTKKRRKPMDQLLWVPVGIVALIVLYLILGSFFTVRTPKSL